MKYDVIIGLEIHAELKTKSKMFCASQNNTKNKQPNTAVCPICLGQPGALPLPANKKAVEFTVLIGLALNCKINQQIEFSRKNYFYPDLPKGYQISQKDFPLAYGGHLNIDGKNIEVTRIHLEEDTAKLNHPAGKDYSLLDYNRAGIPLIELVSEPVIKNAKEAKKFCQIYQQILRYLDISNADMEKGELRCEANVSLQEKGKWKYEKKGGPLGEGGVIKPIPGHKLNPKVELKNINSFRALERAVDYEIKRQVKALEDGEKILQETRGWNEDRGVTVRQRDKETAADYRYFPEPDIPAVKISGEWISGIKSRLIELPHQKKKRFEKEYDLKSDDCEILVSDKNLADYTEKVISELRAWIDSTGDNWERQKKKLARAVSNWLLSELLRHLNKEKKSIKDIKISPENFAELISLVYQGKINPLAGKKILELMYEKGTDPTYVMQDLKLEQIDDKAEIKKIAKNIIKNNKKQVEEYKQGKESLLQYFIGQAMAATQGKANPKIVAEIFKKLLK